MFIKTFLTATLLQTLFLSCSGKDIIIPISLDFNGGSTLPKEERTSVSVKGLCSDAENSNIEIKVDMGQINKKPMNISVFFASEKQEILKLELKENLMLGTKYQIPYKVSKTFEEKEMKENETSFPNSWLPENTTRVSAALEFEDDKVYCTYGIKNNALSIRDLMVVQQYKKFDCA